MNEQEPDNIADETPELPPALTDLVHRFVDDAFMNRRLHTLSRHARLAYMAREVEKARVR